jgi:hypothetical protein
MMIKSLLHSSVIMEKNLFSSRFQLEFKFVDSKPNHTDPSGRTVYGLGLRPLACWGCGFESDRVHGCVSGVCCVLSGRVSCIGLITRSEECGVST